MPQSLGRTGKGSSSICIHSLWFCRRRLGNWVIGNLKSQGMQSHCFLTKSSIPSEANSKPVNDNDNGGSQTPAHLHPLRAC